jgi:hypothetical protein
MPRWRKLRIRKISDGGDRRVDAAEVLFSVPDLGGIDDLGASIMLVGAIVVIAIVIIPLLLFGIELILLGLLVQQVFSAELFSAVRSLSKHLPTNGGANVLNWRVTGWRHSSNLIDEVVMSLEAGLNPATELKINRSLIIHICENPRDEAIARTTIDLARHLDLSVVAEGIETAEVAERLVQIGCDVGQRYFISRPLPAGEFVEWLAGRPALQTGLRT